LVTDKTFAAGENWRRQRAAGPTLGKSGVEGWGQKISGAAF